MAMPDVAARRLRLVEDTPMTADNDATPRLRIAIATQDMKSLNAHFGSARRFAIYDVTAGEHRFIEAVAFDDVTEEAGQHNDVDDRITPKVKALDGVHLLFVLAIGGPAAAKVVGARIHPVKMPGPEPIEAVIARVQSMMTGNPPPWLRKVMGAAQPARDMAFLDD